MYVKRIAAAVAAVSVAAALAVGVAPQPAEAASNSISVAGVSRTNAADTKSKGTIKTPTVRTSGNVSVSSRSYIITKSNRTVRQTSSQGKSYKLGLGTYKVTSTIKYRTYSETKAKTGATTNGWKPVTSVVTWSSWDEGPALPFPETSDLLFWGDCIPGKPDHGLPGVTYYRGSVCEADGKTYRGDLYENDDAGWGFDAKEASGQVPVYKTTRTYSGYKTVQRTQSVTIKNDNRVTHREWKQIKVGMTRAKVKRITGGNGKTYYRQYSSGTHYIDVVYPNNVVINYVNGKVYAKSRASEGLS